jgi:hypothetical protein
MSERKAWFRAKTHGWGWGTAATWQGWATYAAHVALMAWATFTFRPGQDLAKFLACTLGGTGVLLLVCLLKGEKPTWRGGTR